MRRAMLAVMLIAGACTDPAVVDGQQEIAAELRALRTALQQRVPNAAATSPPAVDRQAFTAALAPLREVLDSLVAQQKELQTRQLALTQELQRWSQLLAQSVTGSNRAETEALTARLQQLEATIRQQDARHQEVEKLLGGALDRTADRLEEFLRRLEGTAPGNAPVTPPTPASGGEAAVPKTSGSPGGDAPDGAARKTGSLEAGPGAAPPSRSRRNPTAWWLGLLGTAGLVGAVCVWRWRRSSAARSAVGSPATGASHGPGHEGALDPGVQELWAAAAMLGEALGKLKSEPTVSGRVAGRQEDEGIGLEEVFVLDDDPDAAPGVPTAAVHPAPPSLPRARPMPPTIHCRLPARHPGAAVPAVLQVLAGDPRVLQAPPPTARAVDEGVDVTFAVLPGLSPGELSHIEQRLRDAV